MEKTNLPTLGPEWAPAAWFDFVIWKTKQNKTTQKNKNKRAALVLFCFLKPLFPIVAEM